MAQLIYDFAREKRPQGRRSRTPARAAEEFTVPADLRRLPGLAAIANYADRPERISVGVETHRHEVRMGSSAMGIIGQSSSALSPESSQSS